jgi:DNA-binding SARP family transcriptional activator
MKKYLLAAVLFTACSSTSFSEDDREYIDAKINLHNTLSFMRHSNDSVLGKKDTLFFTKKLTTEEFLTYCKAHDLDPMEAVKKLSDK